MNTRAIAILCVLALLVASLGATGCMGRNAAKGGIREWNVEVVESKWARQFIWLGLTLITVYPLSGLADDFIFNPIEFWTEENPISGERAMVLSQVQGLSGGRDGSRIVARPRADGSLELEIRTADGAIHWLHLAREGERIVARDASGRLRGSADSAGQLSVDVDDTSPGSQSDG